MEKNMSKVQELVNFLTKEIWRLSLEEFSSKKAFLLKKLRIILLTFRCFHEDKCTLRGSALTFYVLMSIVPVAAMAFGVAKGFNMDKKLEAMILKSLSEQSEVVMKVIEFARNILNETRADLMAFVGLIMLFWSVIKVLGNIELSFNEIWGVKESRTLARKFTDYLSMMFLAPVCILIAGSANIFVQSFFDQMVHSNHFVAMFSFIIKPALRLLPLFFLTIFFCFTYIIIPNTKVKFKPALTGGVVAAVLYQLLQILYFGAQAGASKSSPIYGSFAALPLFLIWLQFSWYILLFGAELAFAAQNVDAYVYEADTRTISIAKKRLVSLQIAYYIIMKFKDGETTGDADRISETLQLPIKLVRDVLNNLLNAQIISRVRNSEDESTAYHPSTSIDHMTISYIVKKLENYGSNDIPVKDEYGMQYFSNTFMEFEELIEKSPLNKKLHEI